jgi:hypothetical protein
MYFIGPMAMALYIKNCITSDHLRSPQKRDSVASAIGYSHCSASGWKKLKVHIPHLHKLYIYIFINIYNYGLMVLFTILFYTK